MWSMDDWKYVERQTVRDPKGRTWTVALMDVLGQAGDPDRPSAMLELEYASSRYFTLIYSGSGTLQDEAANAAQSQQPEASGNGRMGPGGGLGAPIDAPDPLGSSRGFIIGGFLVVLAGGAFWLAEPGRHISLAFTRAVAERGWRDESTEVERVWPHDTKPTRVTVHRYTLPTE